MMRSNRFPVSGLDSRFALSVGVPLPGSTTNPRGLCRERDWGPLPNPALGEEAKVFTVEGS